ncbi:MAG: hypothetical protein ACMUIA_04455 [bacterium]
MKRSIILVHFLLLIGVLTVKAEGGVFGTATTLRPGNFAFGLEPCLVLSASEFSFFLHGGAGLVPGIDLDLKIGFNSDTYLGADVEFVLIPDKNRTPGLSFAAGVHSTSDMGFDAVLTLSNRFPTFSFYTALDADFELNNHDEGEDGETEIEVPLYLALGVAIPMARKTEFLFEVDVAVTDSAENILSGGITFYF